MDVTLAWKNPKMLAVFRCENLCLENLTKKKEATKKK